MQRLRLFLLILTVAAGVLIILAGIGWYLDASSPSYYQSSWMGQMWGGMMGRGGMMDGGSTAGSFLWILPVGLIAVTVLGVVGVSFYLVFPEIRSSKSTCVPAETKPAQTIAPSSAISKAAADSKATAANSVSGPTTCDVLLKTMTPEEQKVLNVLRVHKGKYLQKYIGKEAGLNRLQTHRILARFAQRGIVTAKQFGNTNEISLSEWVQTTEMQYTNKALNA